MEHDCINEIYSSQSDTMKSVLFFFYYMQLNCIGNRSVKDKQSATKCNAGIFCWKSSRPTIRVLPVTKGKDFCRCYLRATN